MSSAPSSTVGFNRIIAGDYTDARTINSGELEEQLGRPLTWSERIGLWWGSITDAAPITVKVVETANEYLNPVSYVTNPNGTGSAGGTSDWLLGVVNDTQSVVDNFIRPNFWGLLLVLIIAAIFLFKHL